MFFRLNCRQRDKTVAGSFCGSVVASRNMACGGGSSKVFSKCVEAVVRQHMHFVNEINLVARARWRVLHVFQQLAGVFHLGFGGRIDLNQVNRAPFSNLRTGATLSTRSAVTPPSQLRHLARIRATVVLPTPRVPVKSKHGGGGRTRARSPTPAEHAAARPSRERAGAPFTGQNLIDMP